MDEPLTPRPKECHGCGKGVYCHVNDYIGNSLQDRLMKLEQSLVADVLNTTRYSNIRDDLCTVQKFIGSLNKRIGALEKQQEVLYEEILPLYQQKRKRKRADTIVIESGDNKENIPL